MLYEELGWSVFEIYTQFFFHSNFLKLQCLRTKFRSPPDLILIIHNWLECSRKSLGIVVPLSMPGAEERGFGSDISWQKTTNICQLHQQFEMCWNILSVSFPKLLAWLPHTSTLGYPAAVSAWAPERTDTHPQPQDPHLHSPRTMHSFQTSGLASLTCTRK